MLKTDVNDTSISRKCIIGFNLIACKFRKRSKNVQRSDSQKHTSINVTLLSSTVDKRRSEE